MSYAEVKYEVPSGNSVNAGESGTASSQHPTSVRGGAAAAKSINSLTPSVIPSSGKANIHTLHYAELADINVEPNYENTDLCVIRSWASAVSDGDIPPVPPPPLPTNGNATTRNASSNPTTMERRTKALQCLMPTSNDDKENHRVSYENLHMDYIAELTAEGYSQDAVIRALGITRNDITMARDVLHEFASKKT